MCYDCSVHKSLWMQISWEGPARSGRGDTVVMEVVPKDFLSKDQKIKGGRSMRRDKGLRHLRKRRLVPSLQVLSRVALWEKFPAVAYHYNISVTFGFYSFRVEFISLV